MTWLRGVMQPLTQRANRDKIAEAVRLAEADAAAPAEQRVASKAHAQ
jgi:hypothetical protein